MRSLVAGVLLGGCAAPPGPAESVPVRPDETTRASCTAEVTATTDGVHVETCTARYDEAGRDAEHLCGDEEVGLWHWLGAYDAAGCPVYESFLQTMSDPGFRTERTRTCDEHVNVLTVTGTQVEYDADGAVAETYVLDERYTNTYDADLLVKRVEDGSVPYVETYAYDAEGRLVYEEGHPEGGRRENETTYTYDADGDLVVTVHDSRWFGVTRTDSEHDAHGRETRTETWREYDGVTVVSRTEWEPDVLREARAEVDGDDDGVFETVHDYVWDCP